MKNRSAVLKRRETRKAWLFLLPSLAGVILFVLLPFADVIRRSVSEAMNSNFVGMDNYRTVFANQAFQKAVKNTGRFLMTCIPLLLVISLSLALLINHYGKLSDNREKGKFFKTSYLIPMAIPIASVVLLWKLIFHDNGLINGMLTGMGKSEISFINSDFAFYVLVFTYIWKNAGYDMVLWLGGLDSISLSLYEAASVDGAGALAKFRHITVPDLMPTLFVTAVLSLVNSFKVFREAYLIAGDYPHDSIYMLQHLFNNWFVSLDIQKMSAAAVLMAIVMMGVIVLFRFATGKDESEE